MKVTINSTHTNSFKYTECSHIHKKSKRNVDLKLKCLQVKRNKLLIFNKWFSQEHDYCLPIKDENKLVKKSIAGEKDDKNVDEINNLELDLTSFDSMKMTAHLENINVNNELSSCSLYAIDITTELLKDALLENQLSYKQPTGISKNCTNSLNSYVSSNTNQHCCSPNDVTSRSLNNENMITPSNNEKFSVSKECISQKSFLPVDIDSDMIKLFPTLDFSTEHKSNEQPEFIGSKEINNGLNKHILPENTDNINSKKKQLFNSSFNNIQSSSCGSKRINSIMPNKYKTSISLPKVLSKLSVVESSKNKSNPQLESEQYISIFNRYQSGSKNQFIEQVENPGPVLLRDLLCGSKPKTIISPYTHRRLKPYIFRDPVTKPLWLQMLNELKNHFRKKRELPIYSEVETIDYSYVRAKHINSVNLLAREFFWPGIDLTDSLLYPDFSIVALYKNLVIGFGFMVPDISTNENYITFLFTRPYWTNCGIAKFMIYHLIQTCVTRDITLHVSPNNPAMILYQKFGFKIEEFVQNFYENYIPIESQMSKHALLLRLRNTMRS